MKPFLVVLLAVALTGCASFLTPPDLAHVKVECVDAPRAFLRQTRLQGSVSHLVLSGQVERGFGYPDTTRLHIDVNLLDTAGQIVRSTVVEFSPRQLPRPGHPSRGRAHFTSDLGALPPSATKIEVRLHDGEHMPSS